MSESKGVEAGHYVDLETWPRRAQHAFFRTFEVPFFNVCAPVPVGGLRAWCKAAGVSFNLAAWFACQQAVNGIEEFRTRIRGDRVFVHDRVRMASTFLNEDNTFRYIHFPHADTFAAFQAGAKAAIDAPVPDVLDARVGVDDVVHGSVVPWIRFTGMTHARPRVIAEDSVPKIVFGQVHSSAGVEVMPVSIAAHHACVDGVHIGRLFADLEAQFAQAAAGGLR